MTNLQHTQLVYTFSEHTGEPIVALTGRHTQRSGVRVMATAPTPVTPRSEHEGRLAVSSEFGTLTSTPIRGIADRIEDGLEGEAHFDAGALSVTHMHAEPVPVRVKHLVRV